jgi:hypothetical protein
MDDLLNNCAGTSTPAGWGFEGTQAGMQWLFFSVEVQIGSLLIRQYQKEGCIRARLLRKHGVGFR